MVCSGSIVPPYAELQITSNFSFLRGASHPDELASQAASLGLAAMALTDRNSFAGIVRAHTVCKELGLRFLPAVRLDLQDRESLLAFPTDRAAYSRLCQLLTLGKRRAAKGECILSYEDLQVWGQGSLLIALPPDDIAPTYAEELAQLRTDFGDACYLALHHLYLGNEARRLPLLATLAETCGLPLVATNDVHYHSAQRRPLQDVMTCIRETCVIDEAGWRLHANGERHLKSPAEMTRLFADYPAAIANTLEIVERCRFSLDELRYEYPADPVPAGSTPQKELARLAWEGAKWRYPGGMPVRVQDTIRHELALIEKLDYASYFLTVHDLIRFARGRNILCQGRGSAANSAVCYCLGITAVDPARIDLLFERFISLARNEPPDIDVDFEHERREEVIQYVYEKYGRHRAGMTGVVITYRVKSAIRDVGKTLGLSEDVTGALAGLMSDGARTIDPQIARRHGINIADRRVRLTLQLAREIMGFPRHLSQHPGGLVITDSPLCELVPIENAAMAGRTFIEWDKDDIDALGMLKIDVLALGILTCVRKSFDLVARHYGKRFDLATIPPEDPEVYAMLSAADSIGVFQVESRAQMTMLPRLKPKTFYDLVIEVAIVRPGPIQGDMVHPYLRRRDGLESVNYPSADLEKVLNRTLGVPLFQEQVMQIAIVAAGFTPSEADQLRRAMAAFRRSGSVEKFRDKFITGMVAKGYEQDFAERCFRQIEGFGEYGFPESHAASFALLVYVSAWLKCHYPAAFTAALLNSQPMGFYAPAQLVQDAKNHGVAVLPVDINRSLWDNSLEPVAETAHGIALRLGFRQIKGLSGAEIDGLIEARGNGFTSIEQIWRKSRVKAATLERLAEGDSFLSMGLSRRNALWAATGLASKPLPLFAAIGEDEAREDISYALPLMTAAEEVCEDYRTLRLSLKGHPVAFLRDGLRAQGVQANDALTRSKDKALVAVAGLVLVRQKPQTASGVIFMTLEDETGIANLVIWPSVFERFRPTVLSGRLILVHGQVQKQGAVCHVVVRSLQDISSRLDTLIEVTAAKSQEPFLTRSRDFH